MTHGVPQARRKVKKKEGDARRRRAEKWKWRAPKQEPGDDDSVAVRKKTCFEGILFIRLFVFYVYLSVTFRLYFVCILYVFCWENGNYTIGNEIDFCFKSQQFRYTYIEPLFEN